MSSLHFAVRHFPAWMLALPALAPSVFASNTWYVDDNGSPAGNGSFDNPYQTIQRAISAPGTASGDTIRVRPGLYRERLDFAHSLTILSEAGSSQTVIDAGYRGSAVSVRNRGSWESRLEGFTLLHGTGRYNPIRGESLGGGVFCVNSKLTLVDCTIADNATRTGGHDSQLLGRGGGLYAGVNADVVLEACTLSHNDAVDGGGAFLERGKLTMLGGSVQANRANGGLHAGRGGGLLVGSTSKIELAGVTIEGNLAQGGPINDEALGGGIRIESTARASLDGCTITSNESGGPWSGFPDRAGYGGGVSSMASADDFVMNATILRANRATHGAGMHGKGLLGRCTIENNVAAYGSGGGVEALDVTLLDCVLRSNQSLEGRGGGICASPGGFAKLERCELAFNYARTTGGGGQGAVCFDCDIHDNTVRGDGTSLLAAGGGAFACGLVDCRVWNNKAEDNESFNGVGGGLYGGTALRTVFHHNTADTTAGGVAWSSIDRCTVVFNMWGVHGGTVHDSIVRFNTQYDLSEGASATWSNVPAGTGGVGNLFDDPLFVNAGANDYGLMPGSPCIDAGDPTSTPDPDGSRADMGAIPFSN